MNNFTSATGIAADEAFVNNAANTKAAEDKTGPANSGTVPSHYSNLSQVPPEVLKAFELAIALNVCKRSEKSIKRMKEIQDEARRNGG